MENRWIMASYKDCQVARNVAQLAFNATLYHVWFERNLRQFNNASRLKEKIVDDIVFDVRIKAKALKNKASNDRLTFYLNNRWGVDATSAEPKQVLFTWPHPPAGYWILSYDGSMQNDRAGYGGLIRDEHGKPTVGYAGTSSTFHVLWLEMFALWTGLEIARDNGILDILVHMDSKLGVDIFRNTANAHRKYLASRAK